MHSKFSVFAPTCSWQYSWAGIANTQQLNVFGLVFKNIHGAKCEKHWYSCHSSNEQISYLIFLALTISALSYPLCQKKKKSAIWRHGIKSEHVIRHTEISLLPLIFLSVWHVHLNENTRTANSSLLSSWKNRMQQNPNAFNMIYPLWIV